MKIKVPANNSFGVYNETNQLWWDPKKGWTADLTAWKKSSFRTLLTYTDLTSQFYVFPKGTIKVVDIFTGEDESSQFEKAFDSVYELTIIRLNHGKNNPDSQVGKKFNKEVAISYGVYEV